MVMLCLSEFNILAMPQGNQKVWQLLDLLVKYGALRILEFYRHFVIYKSGFMLLQL